MDQFHPLGRMNLTDLMGLNFKLKKIKIIKEFNDLFSFKKYLIDQ